MASHGMTRRRLLQLGATTAALPYLDALRPRRAHAQGARRGPKRFVLVHTPQGTVLPDFVPTGGERDYALSYILEPLAAHRDRFTVVTGVDNVQPRFNQVGNAHINANYTVLTGRPFLDQNPDALTVSGPSIDQVVAGRIGAGAPFPSLHLAVGGTQNQSGVISPREGAFFWYGPRDPVAAFNSPETALLRIFGDGRTSPADAWALRARRASVLDGVLHNFTDMRRRLGAEDRIRLDAHADKLRALERRIIAGTGECVRPTIEAPLGYDAARDDPVSAPVMHHLAATALSCDLTRVITIDHVNGHAPTFPWLRAINGGDPIVDTAIWENWHAMVHADYQPGMEHAYRWYAEMFADLLSQMASMRDADGDNLLDTSLVVWFSEYSSGRHWNRAIPVVLAGDLGDAPPHGETGRWLDHLAARREDIDAHRQPPASGVTTNQLWTSVLRMFGGDDETFGFNDGSLPMGGLPGLLV